MSLSTEHNSLVEIADFLQRFSGHDIRLLNYGAFGSILRLQIIDPEDDDWIVVLDRVSYLRGKVWWRLNSLDFVRNPDGNIEVRDSAVDFCAVCEECVVLSDDEYGDAE